MLLSINTRTLKGKRLYKEIHSFYKTRFKTFELKNGYYSVQLLFIILIIIYSDFLFFFLI